MHERRHKLIKRHGQNRRQLRNYELGLVEDITLQHLHDLASHSFPMDEPSNPRKPNQSELNVALKIAPHAQELCYM